MLPSYRLNGALTDVVSISIQDRFTALYPRCIYKDINNNVMFINKVLFLFFGFNYGQIFPIIVYTSLYEVTFRISQGCADSADSAGIADHPRGETGHPALVD